MLMKQELFLLAPFDSTSLLYFYCTSALYTHCPQSREKTKEILELLWGLSQPSCCSPNGRQLLHTAEAPAADAAAVLPFPCRLSLAMSPHSQAVTSALPTALNGGAGAKPITYCWGAKKRCHYACLLQRWIWSPSPHRKC